MLDCRIIDSNIAKLKGDVTKFLDLSGRKAYWSQGFYGQGITVAVVDTGVASQHEELQGRVLKGKSFVAYTKSTEDDMGHGTHCAGTIAGENVGKAPLAEILPIKVLDGSGGGDLNDIIKALQWLDTWRHPETKRRADIVSMSLSTPEKGITSSQKRIMEQAINTLVKNGTLVVCSAGNSKKKEKRYPAAFQEVVCVGAVDVEKEAAYFQTTGNHVDLCEIGVDVLSAWYKGGYAVMSGTSMSTPAVAGTAALIACKHLELFGKTISEDFLYKTLMLNSKDLGIEGIDPVHGTGFCTLQPIIADTWTQDGNKNFVVNDKVIEMEIPSRIEGGRFLLPLRYLSEAFGGYVKWDEETRSAVIKL